MVRIDDPPSMNVLGLFLASALRRNLVVRGKGRGLRGTLAIDAEGMRALVRFEADGATVTRKDEAARATVSGPLSLLVKAVAKRTPFTLLRLRVRGSRIFALRALGLLKP
ncbi:MAG: hypothetical protein ACHQ1G_04250 [Planctomycetota bacterium]